MSDKKMDFSNIDLSQFRIDPRKFNPMIDAPKTEEEMVIALKHEKEPEIARDLVAIFRLYLQMGKRPIEAYRWTLHNHMGRITFKDAQYRTIRAGSRSATFDLVNFIDLSRESCRWVTVELGLFESLNKDGVPWLRPDIRMIPPDADNEFAIENLVIEEKK